MNAAGIIALAGAYGVSLTADTKRIIAKPAARLTPGTQRGDPQASCRTALGINP